MGWGRGWELNPGVRDPDDATPTSHPIASDVIWSEKHCEMINCHQKLMKERYLILSLHTNGLTPHCESTSASKRMTWYMEVWMWVGASRNSPVTSYWTTKSYSTNHVCGGPGGQQPIALCLLLASACFQSNNTIGVAISGTASNVLCGISKVTFEVPWKIFYPYIEWWYSFIGKI